MKSPFRKVRGLGLHRHDKRHRGIQRSSAQLDELSQASQDMQDMKDCYDSLLTAAASTTNTVYEFSDSLQEMGSCLLEKTALGDDEDSGRVLLMLGKVQFQIQKFMDKYRSHISQTITVPSQSLLNELNIVEDMKKQCDEKRAIYEEMKIQYEKGKMKNSKSEHVSSRQLQTASDEFDEDATLFIFRMKSLKNAQSRSLLTQAARHYAAQINFFRKSLKSLEAIEPHLKSATEQQHIDYHFSGLEDDDDDNDRDSVFLSDDEDEDDDTFEDSELTIDPHTNVKKIEVSISENSVEARFNSTIDLNKGSKSAPLSIESNYDPSERYRQMRQSSTRKLNTYVLPTPLEKSQSQSQSQGHKPKPPTHLYHSMPLEKNSGKPTPLPAPQIDPRAKKIKRYAYSGPLTGDSQLNKTPLYASGPIGSTARHLPKSGSVLQASLTQPLSCSPLSASMVSLPVISELHELPRPPAKMDVKKPKVGFSAPLVTFKSGPDTNMISPPLSPIDFKVT